jgi:hypothetical protein
LAFAVAGCESWNNLGPLSDYYRYDCTGRHRPDKAQVRRTLRLALAGDHHALHEVFSDYQRFGSGDNESWWDLPEVFMRELGDDRYSAFLESQRKNVRRVALPVCPEQIPDFYSKYPTTAKLLYELVTGNHRQPLSGAQFSDFMRSEYKSHQ